MVDAARAHTRQRILQTFTPAAEPFARALMLGENDLDPEDDAAFKLSGLAHLLAVSGTHLVLAVVFIVKLLRAFLVRSWWAQGHDVERWAAGFGSVLALVYADFAGGSGSAWRAAWMLFVVFGARALGRHAPVSRSFALSVVVGALADPLVSFDISFMLSAAATAGLVTTGPTVARACARIGFGPVRYLLQNVATTLSAMLPCTPLLALLSPGLTVAGAFANVIAAPLGEMVALPLCLLHALFGWSPAIEQGMALIASGALLVVRQVAILGGDAHALSFPVALPGAWELVLLCVASTGLLLLARSRLENVRQRSMLVTIGLIAAVMGLGLLQRARVAAAQPRGRLRVTAIDAGQGDATLIDLPDGRLMLVDGGGTVGGPDPGKLVILPLLRQRRRQRVDIAVLTHAHPDHLQGLATVVNAMEVGELWAPWEPAHSPPVPALRSLLAVLAARGTPVHAAQSLCSAPPQFGGARISVLSPCDPNATPAPGNDGSLVLRISFGQRSVLLQGDAEAHREQELLARGGELSADLLKVGHHGSRNASSSQWLERVQPMWATIACGVRNPHGHPHPETVARLAHYGARVFRLDRTGSMEWSTDGHAVTLRVFEGH
jgi:competence protein ComEC